MIDKIDIQKLMEKAEKYYTIAQGEGDNELKEFYGGQIVAYERILKRWEE